MSHVAIDGVSVPAALAPSFSDPNKRPFSYTQPVPPSSDSERPTTPYRSVSVSLPKVLPIFGDKNSSGGGGNATATFHSNARSITPVVTSGNSHHGSLTYLDRPTNLQYNTPLPLYSKESAEEQYKQQTGAGPDVPLGVGDKHFDPEKSETLKAIRAGEDDSFGKTFYEKIAQAEAPKVFIDTEPEWTEQARLKAERARSATPSSYAARQTPTPSYNPNYATIHGTSSVSTKKRIPTYGKGYEFGGIDYYGANNQKTSDISYRQSGQWINDDRKSTPMYDISSVDSSKANISTPSSYHGHGPEHPRLQPKYTGFKKSNEMNIETAPNINNVSANVFVGDTVSNQKIYKENVHKQKDPFGTSFAPPEGFKEDHKTVSRQENSQKFGTYSLSARKDYINQGNKEYQENSYKPKPRSYSAAPMDRYDSSTYGTKEVTVETLLNDTALYPRKKLELPYWHSYSLEKQDRWKNGSDPRLSRPQDTNTKYMYNNCPSKKEQYHYVHKPDNSGIKMHEEGPVPTAYSYEPPWSRTVREKKGIWETQTQNLESRLQLPASQKIPVHQPPYWYNQANQTHNIWQTAADRNAARAQSESVENSSRYAKTPEYSTYGTSYSTETRQMQDYTTGYKNTINSQHYQEQRQFQPQQQHYKEEEYKLEKQTINSQNTSTNQASYHENTAVPTPFEQRNQLFSENLQKWKTRSAPSSNFNYYSKVEKSETKNNSYSSSQYEQDKKTNEKFVTEPKTIRTYEIHQSDATHNAPVTTKQVITVTEGTGSNFNRAAEMAEVLPRGSIANTEASTQGNYTDTEGREVSYTRELVTSVDPHRECSLLKEEERRVVETPYEPGIISRHVTTKYYKKKTVTDTTTTTTTTAPQ